MSARVTAVFCVLFGAATAAAPAQADALDGALAVRSAYVNVDGGVFKLHARIEYPENDEIRAALADGVTLLFEADALVARERRLWWDAKVVEVTLQRELSYHTVSGRYLVRDARSGSQENYASLAEALAALGTIDDWPILVAPQISDDARYRVSVRAGVRRGRLPDTLRAVLFWSDSWHRTSEWYSWSLPI
jgi:hypothetical protein